MERRGQFDNFVLEAVLECALELEDAFLYVVIPLIIVGGLFLLVYAAYQSMLDPYAAGFTACSDFLSIDPDKWFPRS